MTRHLFISSSSNPRVKAVRRLSGRRAREAGVFLVEGHRPLRRALEASAEIRELYAAPSLFLGDEDALLVEEAARRGARIVELAPGAFAALSGNVRADGLLAVVERWPTGLERCPADGLLLVAEAVERPGNLGTIVRTACAAGAAALVVCDGRTDLFHSETVRGSVGAIFQLPVATATTERARAWLRANGARIVVATPDAPRAHWEADYRGRVAIVVGNERYGVSAGWHAAAHERVHIPMPGPADSLNVAVASGVVLFEAAKQRSRAGPLLPKNCLR